MEGPLAVLGKRGRRIAQHQLGKAVRMGEREGECDSAAETIADQDGIIADTELLEAIFEARHIGVHDPHYRL